MSGHKAYLKQIFYTDIEVAEMLGIARGTVWKLSREGHLAKPCRMGGRITRWHVDDIVRYIDTIHKESRLESEAT